MPALRQPEKPGKIILPERQAQLAAETDVLVVGGGPSGIGAALGAAAAGAKVILAERYGFFGGNATAALVMPLMSFHTQAELKKDSEKRDKPDKPELVPVDTSLLPVDHGEGRPVIAGVLSQLLARLVKMGGAISPSLKTGYVIPFDPEIFKLIALDLLDEAGVQYLFHAFASDVIGKKKIKGVVFETKSGPVVIHAKTIVDCSGDGDIAALAGAPYEIGRLEDGLTQPMTLMFRMVEFQNTAFNAYIKEHPHEWYGVHGLWDLVKKAAAAGELDLPRDDILFFSTPHEHEVSINCTRVTKVLGTNVWDLSYAEWLSRKQMGQIVAFLCRYVPGFEKSYLVQSGSVIGVRETRRIIGDYQISTDDILNARKFDDVIAQSTYPIDIHDPKGKGTILKRIPPGEAYQIPLRCLLPQRVDNLLVAGRCISGTHEAHSSYRVMPVSMATGQAAGVCAALAAREGKLVRAVPVKEVQNELFRQGANLGQ